MTADEIAARFDTRPGYKLVDYGDVGLPIFLISAVAIVQEPKNLHAIEEFILRCTVHGLTQVSEVSGFLGLDRRIIDKVLPPMLQEDMLGVQRSGEALELAMRPKGRQALSEAGLVRPEEKTIAFTYDGITRRPKYVEFDQLLLPRELKEAGIPEIPALPARSPDVEEVSALDVEDVVALATRNARRTSKILKLKSFERRERHFLPSVALVYRDEASGGYRVSFAISGRLSEEHERAFAESDGLKRSQRFAHLGRERPPELKSIVGEQIARDLPGDRLAEGVNRALAAARVMVTDASKHLEDAKSEEDRLNAERVVDQAKQKFAAAENTARRSLVRHLPVYEHPAILKDALATAKSRLLILSPWIRRSVVSRAMVKSLGKLLDSGVQIHIGFGLGESDEGAQPHDREAIGDLEKLSSSRQNFVFKRLGDTHAKVVIKDDEYFVISSFNWLSFQGNPNRTFREEWGTYVAMQAQVNTFYDELLIRFKAE